MTTPIGQFVDTTIGRTSTNPFITMIMARPPTGNDGINNNLLVGQRWIDTSDKNTEWFLLNFVSSQGVVQANWVQLASGGNATETLTGNSGGVVTADSNLNINVVGDGTTGLLFSGASHTLTGTLNAIPNSALAHSAITLVAGTGISITTSPVSLGGTTTISDKIATAAASSVLGNAGIASFSTANFAVDANGFVTSLQSQGFITVASQQFTITGTYTPTAGMVYCQIECVGGGGGAGAANAAGAMAVSAAGGGSAGSYSRGIFSAATIGASQTVTVGTGGAGATSDNASGGNGGTTSVGVLITAPGGVGSSHAPADTTSVGAGGAGGSPGSGGNLNIAGSPGGSGFGFFGSTISGLAGNGGSSYFGSGGIGATSVATGTAAGSNGNNYGSGGGGGFSQNSTTGLGGSGSAGYVIITEYIG